MHLKILLSGSSGFIGSTLLPFLRAAGCEVIRLVRSRAQMNTDTILWDPVQGELNKDDFEGFDAVIHLAGAGIVHGRWTAQRKEELSSSRCRDTWLLSQVLCRLYRPPQTLLCASAIGFYGDRDREVLTEESSPGSGFLATLCQKWEKSADAIENRGTRVCFLRFGAVLGAHGGILAKMLPLFRWGLGGRLGSGQQIVSWIGIDDLIGSIYHCLMHQEITGPVNCVAPHPVTQMEFARTLAFQLKRPACCHVPAFLLKMVLGQAARELLLCSQSVKPQKLLETGYAFRFPALKAALAHAFSSDA